MRNCDYSKSNAISRAYDYDVFGTPLQNRPERFHYGFTGNRQRKLQGKEYDSWTGLYNYGFRDYASLYGRFTSVDPIQDGHNWLAYAASAFSGLSGAIRSSVGFCGWLYNSKISKNFKKAPLWGLFS